MKCLVCSKELLPISGKFGVFFSCRGHGTISKQGTKVVATGAMLQSINQNLLISKGHVEQYKQCSKPFDLEQEVRNKMVGFGYYMTDLDLFIEGGDDTANDDQDHWMNLRPY